MNITKYTVLALLSIGLVACGGAEKGKKKEGNKKAKVENVEKKGPKVFKLDPEKSKVIWKGNMIGMYFHEGTATVKNGRFKVNGGEIKGGKVTIDLTTINPTDENYSEEHPKEGLVQHLATDDFFNTAEFPTATFAITGSEDNKLMGDLTIKGVTKPATATNVNFKAKDGKAKVSGELVFNRQDFGVSYKSTMEDMVLSDDIEIKFTAVGKLDANAAKKGGKKKEAKAAH